MALLREAVMGGDVRQYKELREKILRPTRKPVRPGDKPDDSKPVIHLVVGDSHSRWDVPNERYSLLGRFIAWLKPDVVVDIGDWWDMPALSSYDRGTVSFEGKRYWRDIVSGVDAQARMQDELDRHAPKSYRPFKLRTLGNHEERIMRVAQADPRFEGLIGYDDLQSSFYGWDQRELGEPTVVNGVAYCHWMVSGNMGRPIGGENPAATLLKKHFHSCVVGHSHLFDYAERYAMGRRMCAAQAGCFFEHDDAYAGPQVNVMRRRGLLVLRDVMAGEFEPEWWGMDRLRRQVG